MKLKRMRETLFFSFLDILLLSEHADYIMKTEECGAEYYKHPYKVKRMKVTKTQQKGRKWK